MADFPRASEAHPQPLGRKLGRAFRFAYAGLAYAWRAERNFRLEVMLGLLALALAFYLEVPLWPIILASALVLTLELLNTAIEAAIDLLAPGYHPLAERAKDAAAAAVLVASIAAALTGAFLFIPVLWAKVVG